jgi:hypothetical protein
MANLEIKKSFTVAGVEYDTKEEAMKALAMEVLNTEIPKGLDNVVTNAAEIIKALRIIKK